MRYLSVCSGIEAATVAWHPLGWQPLAFSEIEAFPRAVLANHYPDVPLHGDFTILRDQNWIVDADILVGGTPCQAFSIAGQRLSLSDDRGNLSLEFVRLADAIDNFRFLAGREPAIIVWENVPGVLSVKDNAFGCFLAAIVGNDTPLVPTGKRWTNAGMVVGPQRAAAWRILDAQYFGVAQRRRRLFVVASSRKGFDPAEVLFEREGVRRDTPPSRCAGQEITSKIETGFGKSRGAKKQTNALSHWDGDEFPHPTLNQSASGSGGIGASNQEVFSQRGAYLAPFTIEENSQPSGVELPEVAQCLTAGSGQRYDPETETIIAATLASNSGGNQIERTYIPIAFHPTQTPISSTDGTTHAMGCGTPQGAATIAVAFAQNTRDEVREMDIAGALAANPGMKQTSYLRLDLAVRRLTPRECERLQGFPDDYTLIQVRGKDAADGPRYKALGNSMAVPVMRWIGNRIEMKMGGKQ